MFQINQQPGLEYVPVVLTSDRMKMSYLLIMKSMIMKTNITYIFFFIILSFTACSEDQEGIGWISPEECTTIEQLIKNNSFLKEITEDDNIYILSFETQSVTLNRKDIKDITVDKENWNTTVTFPDNSALDIPTVGTSIDQFIGFVNLDPSHYNPLAAEIRLNLPGGGVIKTIVHTKEGHKTPNVEHKNTFTSENVQFITILGLYEDYTNQVELVYMDRNGSERARAVVEIPVKKLNFDYLPKIEIEIAEHSEIEPEMNLLCFPGRDEDDTSMPFMVDADGEIRWLLNWEKSEELLHIGSQCSPSRLRNGNFLLGDANNQQLVEVDMLGKIINRWDLDPLGYGFHHEVIEDKDGNFLITVSKWDAELAVGNEGRENDHIIKFDPKANTVLKEWDLALILDSARYSSVDSDLPGASFGQTKGNWAHNNAISEWGDDYLSSARFQGIFKFSDSGELKWIISPHKNWRKEYEKYLLNPLDKAGNEITDLQVISGEKSSEAFDWAWGVHCPVLLPNGNIIAFDNGYCRNYIPLPYTAPDLYSRIVEYEVDEENMTVRQVWQYGVEEGRTCYAPALSGVQYLEKTDHRLFCTGMGNKFENGKWGGHIIEIDPKTNKIVFRMKVVLNGGLTAFHRANRISLYPEGF